MQHQARLLLFRLRRDKPHRRSRDRLADCGSVVGIVFAALQISFYVARRQQPHRVAERPKPPAPIMRARTRLNANEASRQACEEVQQLRSSDAPPHHRRARDIYAVNLKNRLRDIETDRANLAMDGSPQVVRFDATTLWHLDASEWAPSTASEADRLKTSTSDPDPIDPTSFSSRPPISHHLKIHSADQVGPVCLGGFHVGHSLLQSARV